MELGISLGLTRLGNVGFSPASLFTGGVQGAWYDPSDYSTLFQDSAGTTPVTAVEQPVGLMLDKSQGLVLGPDLVTNGDNETALFSFGSLINQDTVARASAPGGGFAASFTSSTSTSVAHRSYDSASSLLAGKNYRFTGRVYVPTGGVSTFRLFDNGDGSWFGVAITAKDQWVSFDVIRTAKASNWSLGIGNNVADVVTSGQIAFWLDNLSIRELPGNHASQATAASRPVLRARYNLLTYSEQFDNAAWNKSACAIAANSIAAPDGTTTADTLTASAGLNFHYVTRTGPSSGTGQFVHSFYVKKNTATWIFFTVNDSFINYFNLDTGLFGTTPDTCTVVAEANGWYRISVVRTLSAANLNCGIGIAGSNGGANFTAAGTESIYIWGADLRTGSSAGTYQRIAAATDYATAGFLPYLYFDGSDDYLTIANTNDLNFGQGSFWAQTGLTSLGASQYDVVWGKSSASNDNIRLFLISTDNLGVFWGTDAQSYAGSTFQITKNTAQIQEWGINSSGPTAFYALNGTENTPAITLSGTGSNSSPAYIGINNNLTQYQTQMNLYGMILRKGTLPTAAQRTASRNWMAAKSGAVL